MTATYLDDFATATTAASRDATPDWLTSLRQAGIARFADAGFPAPRDEDWRFTNIGPITSVTFRAVAPGATIDRARVAPFCYDLGGPVLVFVNGHFAFDLSRGVDLPIGATVGSLAHALPPVSAGGQLQPYLGKLAGIDRNGFVALNTAFARDGLFVHLRPGVELGRPIQAVFIADRSAEGAALHPRNVIVLERGAAASIVESYVGLDGAAYFTNAVTEALVGDGASLTHVKLQRESERGFHVANSIIREGRDGNVRSHSVSVGAAICRNNLDLILDGPGSNSQLLGLYLGQGNQEVDNHTLILHAHPACSTREVYKGILDDRSHGIFNGKIYVTPEAQQTDAKQTNRALLLSDSARIDTKPQLEIFADDVKCTHGATVGNIDAMAAFYLRSRGIGLETARRILIYAFAAEILEGLPDPGMRADLESLVRSRLEQRSAR